MQAQRAVSGPRRTAGRRSIRQRDGRSAVHPELVADQRPTRSAGVHRSPVSFGIGPAGTDPAMRALEIVTREGATIRYRDCSRVSRETGRSSARRSNSWAYLLKHITHRCSDVGYVPGRSLWFAPCPRERSSAATPCYAKGPIALRHAPA